MTSILDAFRRAAARLDDPPDQPEEPDPPADAAAGPASTIDEDLLMEALSTVIDPEIGLDIVTLGLVYVVEVGGNTVRVVFSLTTPGCPMEEVITGGIVNAVSAVPGVEQVIPDLVWEPRWHPGMIRGGIS